MANTQPRRLMPKREKPLSRRIDDEPWKKGDPTRRIGLNTPIDEPLMLMLDFLIEHRVIYSKAAFIRETVGKAASEEIRKFRRMREAVKRIEAEDKRK